MTSGVQTQCVRTRLGAKQVAFDSTLDESLLRVCVENILFPLTTTKNSVTQFYPYHSPVHFFPHHLRFKSVIQLEIFGYILH